MPSDLSISFSGGRTSGYMLKLLMETQSHRNPVITFANTGCESEETLRFVDQCDREFTGGKVVWLEAKIDPRPGVGIRHNVVTYETASRKGEPFEAYIAKHGIPNPINPACTNHLKEEVMCSYLKTLGMVRGKKLNYDTAIGIRSDEADRVSERANEHRFIYPLVSAGVTKGQVISFWKRMPFDLQIKNEAYGNCTWCWKKSMRKLLTLAKHNPEVFDFPLRMEAKYGDYMVHDKANKDGKRVFFRGYKSAADIIQMGKEFPYHKEFYDIRQTTLWDDDLDVGGGCGSSCEIGAS